MDQPGRFDRIMSWALPAIAAATPLVIVYSLQRPNVGQAYFFILATFMAAAAQGGAWAFDFSPMPRRLRAPLFLFALGAVAVLASLPASRSQIFSLKQLLLPAAGVLFYMLVTASPLRRAILPRVSLAMMAVGGLLAIYGIGQHFGLEILNYSDVVRKNAVIATIGHPNYLSSVLGPIVFLTVSMYFSTRRKAWGIPALGLVLLCLCCIILARTRSIWLGLAVATLFMFAGGALYSRRNRAARPIVGKLGLGILVSLIGLVLFGGIVTLSGNPIGLKERLGSQKEISSRFFYWNAAIDLGRERPVFGRGYAMFDPEFWPYVLRQQKTDMGKYYRDMFPAVSGTNPGHAHNEYIEAFFETGVFGLTALVALLGFFLCYGWLAMMREPDERAAFQRLAVLCALVLMCVDASLAFPWRLPVSLIMLMLTLAWIHEFIHDDETT